MHNDAEVQKSKPTTVNIKTKIHSELLNILFKQSNHMLWAEAFAASLILFILWWPKTTDKSLLLGWYAYMFLAAGLPRYFLTNAYLKIRPTCTPDSLWEKGIMCSLIISAIGWSFVGTILLPRYGLNQALVLFLLIAIAATANPFYSPIKKIYAAFLIPTLVITALSLLSSGTSINLFIGLALFSFGILMLITSFVSSNLIATALQFRFQNMELAENLLMANKTLEKLATHDSLTRLPNRQCFNDLLKIAMVNATQHQTHLALMFLDIDKFKQINDTLGHDAGDQLLIIVAERLRANFHSIGKVCRLGGDEFIALLDNIDNQEIVAHVAERLRATLAEPIKLKHRTISITSSIGISIYPKDGVDEEALIKHADIAMYKSKKSGGNSYKFYCNETKKTVLEE
jgi:diguanylate cyclase (GGDEF)-like protein